MSDQLQTLSAVVDRRVEKAMEKNRLKILDVEKAEQVLTDVFECARGLREMSAIELRAAEVYLRKCVPDLRSVEVSGSINMTLEQLVVGSMKEVGYGMATGDTLMRDGVVERPVIDVGYSLTPQDAVPDLREVATPQGDSVVGQDVEGGEIQEKVL